MSDPRPAIAPAPEPTRIVEAQPARKDIAALEERVRLLGMVLQATAAAAEHDRFAPAALALCGTIAAEWTCSRVSLGLVRERRVALAAMSHAEKIARASRLVQDIEAAMEECADQDIEVATPARDDEPVISRAHAELRDRQGSGAILSLPIRRAGRVEAVLTLEREDRRPFTAGEVEALRMACELAGTRILLLNRAGRWFGPRAVEAAAAVILGPRHTWAKLTALAVFASAAFLAFVPGVYRVEGTFRVEASAKRVIPAPFDGYIREVFAEAGDTLAEPGAVLARLDDSELRLQLSAVKAELAAFQRQVAVAQREGKEAEAQIARARAEQSAARASLLEYQIERASLAAPEPGMVLTGDAVRLRGAAVRTGEVLFEVAPLDALRADAFIPDDRIAGVRTGQRGQLAAAAYPDRRIAFTVERIDPAAELRQERNVFRVRLRLDEVPPWLRPGMEGLARIDIDRRPFGRILFGRFGDWVRMRLWL